MNHTVEDRSCSECNKAPYSHLTKEQKAKCYCGHIYAAHDKGGNCLAPESYEGAPFTHENFKRCRCAGYDYSAAQNLSDIQFKL